MVQFILAFDPIIRWISALISPYDPFVGAYCDDVGLVVRHLSRVWSILVRVFSLVTKFSSLHLNVTKTQILVIYSIAINRRTGELEQLSPAIGDAITNAIKYLGVYIGPGAPNVQWKLAIKGFKEAAAFVRGLETGYVAKCSLFNVLAFSRLSWLASFIDPPPEILVEVRNAVNRLSRGPWNAFPYRFAKNLKAVGCKIQISDLKKASIAGRVRNALDTTTCFSRCWDFVQQSLIGFERILRVPQREWLDSSIIYNLQHAINLISPHFPTIRSMDRVDLPSQHKMYHHLLELEGDVYACDLLARRMQRFFPGDAECATHVTHITNIYRIISKTHIHTIIIAHMRAVLNQWSTSHRYGQPGACVFCGDHEDKLEHILICLKLHRF